MQHPDAKKWDGIYLSGSHQREVPVDVLKDFNHLLPESGKALDLACGTGANALYLAQSGLETCAWDISAQAIGQLKSLADKNGLTISTEIRDVVTSPPEKNSFDVIVVSYFLDRDLTSHLKKALRKHGLLFYQTYIRDKVNDIGPNNEAYRLDKNELLSLFSGLHVIYYHEEGCIGNIDRGFRNEAMFIGQKL